MFGSRQCAGCFKTIHAVAKLDKERNVVRDKPHVPPCYISPVTPHGCKVSHLMHPAIEVWFDIYRLIGPETSIAQALPLLDRAEATPQDWDIFLAIRAWMAEARDERRESEKRQQGG